MDLPGIQQVGTPPERERIAGVLTQEEIQRVLSMSAGAEAVLVVNACDSPGMLVGSSHDQCANGKVPLAADWVEHWICTLNV